jgi:hypothetical protein
MFVIVFSQNNIVNDGQNNKLVYKFPNSVVLKDKYIAVSSISMYYSWFNITSTFVNNIITYTWTVAAVTTTYTILIPDGLYEIRDINSYCQFVMIQNGHYWISPAGDNVYPFEIIVNPNRYAIQLNTFYVPTATPPLYTTPTNFAGWPSTAQNSVVTFPANINIIFGYPAGFASVANIGGGTVFPPATAATNYATINGANTISYLSNTSPQVQPNNTVLFSLSNISNPYSQPSSIIYSLNPSVDIGEQIFETPPNFMWNKMIDGTYNELRLTFLGNDLQPLRLADPNMTILLTIRDRDEGFLSAK